MKKGDILIIFIILTLALFINMFINNLNSTSSKKYVIVQIDKEVIKKLLIEDTTDKTIEFKFKNELGYLQIKDGKIRMLEMDELFCPEKICSETGWINNRYETIVCLPNKISINIENFKEVNKTDIDEVSF
ncbi:NusG domain II-containing protein [Clostridium sp. D2Q-11]|uniref:NusG domain II-containing protein n=1 Tax=Anaeromonas frigoriresistens TaxID=2683708 RepID=A0A942USB0_9FIRM|nr:NusG domain II-containing protein [Anaeromonas frigoriresistens]MBS4538248.1 NusG domain II-containing protein [Anaeromonas frigoriresistens]